MTIFIARRHPRHPFFRWDGPSFLEAFTIVGTFQTREEAKAFVKQKMNRFPTYLYTVGKVELKAGGK